MNHGAGHKSTYLGRAQGGRNADAFRLFMCASWASAATATDCAGREQQPRQNPETDYKVFLIFRRRTRTRTRRKEKITSAAADVQMWYRHFPTKKIHIAENDSNCDPPYRIESVEIIFDTSCPGIPTELKCWTTPTLPREEDGGGDARPQLDDISPPSFVVRKTKGP